MPRSLEACRNMEHLPQKLYLSIHNYADSGVIHNLPLSHFSRVDECTCKWVFWQNVRCLIQNIITSEPQLQFQWKKLKNVALVAGFNLHSLSSLNSQKREIYGHFSGEHLFKKNSNIWKYHETNISCAHILELYIFPWRVQTVALDCAWRFKIYVPSGLQQIQLKI